MEEKIKLVLDNFDFVYMIVVNVLTYLIIKGFDAVNGVKKVPTIIKRLCLVAAIVIVLIAYDIIGYENKLILVNSTILAPIFWSWIAKPILNKFGLAYKNVDEYLG